MSILLRILVGIMGMVLIYLVIKANVARKITERQSLFWIIAGVIIIMFGLFPQLVYYIAELFSVDYPPSIIFAIAIILAIYGIFNCYKTNAELSARVQELAMQVSLIKEENDSLKQILDEKNDSSKQILDEKNHSSK